ncbi:MAG: alkaline phosphatase family protein [Coriobacteriia bacterium]|nr:alkaline phosphatase family protein [Coriobacteriia bacterium]
MRTFLLWLAIPLMVLGSLTLAYGAYDMASEAWDGIVDYQTPYLASDLPASYAGPPVAESVILIIVDGLREDASREMSSLESLRDYGASLILTAPQPSLSYPNWTTVLTGTRQDVHGVVTNWHEGRIRAETLLDTAYQAKIPYVVVGPSDIATLYPAARQATGSFFLDWSEEYLSGRYIDETLRLIREKKPRFVLLHLPDVDEVGHSFGGGSPEYAQMVGRVDTDLRRLVEQTQGTGAAFVVVADHGHIDTGGHGGWEPEVVSVPGVIAGEGVRVLEGEARLEDIAPTVAVMAGFPSPRNATGQTLDSALATSSAAGVLASQAQRNAAARAYAEVIAGPAGVAYDRQLPPTATAEVTTQYLQDVSDARLAADRAGRLSGQGVQLAIASVLTLLFVLVASWRAFVAAICGSAAYYAVYNILFFVVHGNRWSLSSFNSEDLIEAWMNTRLIEAAIAGLVAAVVAAAVYPLLRRHPKQPSGRYLPGWLVLGPLAVVVTQLTLALQVAWFLWAWGLEPTWRLPDLMWGFKCDLDLVQITALGAAVLLSPALTYVVGRYHPLVRVHSSKEA